MQRTACLTGSSGFIGRVLARTLVEAGWQVRCLVRKTGAEKFPSLPMPAVAGIEPIQISEHDDSGFQLALAGASVFFHLAGVVRGRSEQEFFKGNVEFTRRVLTLVERHRGPAFQRFCQISSLASLGPARERVALTESSPPHPLGWYGNSKWQGEQAVLEYAQRMPVTILRPCAVYGPGDRAFLPLFRLLRHGPILYPAGNFRLSLVQVEDLAAGILQSVETALPSGSIYHLAGNGEISSRNLGRQIAELYGRHPWEIPVPAALVRGGARLSEWRSRHEAAVPFFNRQKALEMCGGDWLCDSAKARTAFHFAPRWELADGLRSVLAWYRQAGWL